MCQRNEHYVQTTAFNRPLDKITLSVSTLRSGSALLFFRLASWRWIGVSRQPWLAVGGCRLSGGGWRCCWLSRQSSPDRVKYAAEEDGAEKALDEKEGVVDADEEIKQAEEDEHADDTEVQMMM